MSIDCSSLSDALRQLESGMAEYQNNHTSELLRDGVIQRFEYTFELSIKLLKRVLETIYNDPVDQLAFHDILRTGYERGLLANSERWIGYRVARNKTSHTYHGGVASGVFSCIAPFIDDIHFTLSALQRASQHYDTGL